MFELRYGIAHGSLLRVAVCQSGSCPVRALLQGWKVGTMTASSCELKVWNGQLHTGEAGESTRHRPMQHCTDTSYRGFFHTCVWQYNPENGTHHAELDLVATCALEQSPA